MAHLSEKIGYGLGDMSSSMFWKVFSYYLPFFYSNVFYSKISNIFVWRDGLFASISQHKMPKFIDIPLRHSKIKEYRLLGISPRLLIVIFCYR